MRSAFQIALPKITLAQTALAKTALAKTALAGLAVFSVQAALAQSGNGMKSVVAGEAFSISTTGSGSGTLLIIGPGQVLRRDVTLGQDVSFPAGALYNAGTYVVMVESANAATPSSDTLDVLPGKDAANVTFLARPSRLPVSLHDGITGAVYVADKYHNLVTTPLPVSFELSNSASAVQKRVVQTRYGAAWTGMDSTSQQGNDKFVARAGGVVSTRIVEQVPGDPCSIKISAKEDGKQADLTTEPVRDCNGNAVPDGTIVTFTESYRGGQSTVDVPLKRGVAQVQMPIHSGATITVASGVVMGNQIGLGR